MSESARPWLEPVAPNRQEMDRPAIAGQIAARVDRLPLTRVQWELAILVEIAWGSS